MKDVDFDADQFMKDMEKLMGHHGSKDIGSDLDLDEGLSSDLDYGNLSTVYVVILFFILEIISCRLFPLDRAGIILLFVVLTMIPHGSVKQLSENKVPKKFRDIQCHEHKECKVLRNKLMPISCN